MWIVNCVRTVDWSSQEEEAREDQGERAPQTGGWAAGGQWSPACLGSSGRVLAQAEEAQTLLDERARLLCGHGGHSAVSLPDKD